MTDLTGKYVVVRGDRSGVFAGTLVAREGREVELADCRRLWYWDGAATISQIAEEGIKAPSNCKFTMCVESIIIIDVIEVIPTTATAEQSIKEVKEWKM